jgi:membrane protein
MSFVDRAKERFHRARGRYPLLDHLVVTVQHYGSTQGAANAGNITYFGFLSFFPLLAIAFAVVGVVSQVYPDAQEQLETALRDVFPGIIGNGDGQISLTTFQDAAGAAGLVGVVGLLYSGLNWLSAMRQGLEHVFDLEPVETASFVGGKLRDLVTLGAVGVVLILSVAISTTVTGFSDDLRRAVQLDEVPGTGILVGAVGVLVGVAASTVLFMAIFKLLADPDVPLGALRRGAMFSAIGFEALKLLATYLLASAAQSPAAAVFGTALVLVVWIHYFAVVTLMGASWAETSPLTLEARAEDLEAEALAEAEQMLQVRWGPSAPADEEAVERPEEVTTIVRSAVTFGAITLLLRRMFKD